jgi:hypothetical protein
MVEKLAKKKSMCSRYVSEEALDAALTDAKNDSEVNSHRLLTRKRSAADGMAPSESRALNSGKTYSKKRAIDGA